MRLLGLLLSLFCLVCAGEVAQAASAKLIKVLPHYLDRDGRHTLSPSLYERDAYQAHLRRHPDERSGLRFDLQWKARAVAKPTLRVDLRGAHGKETTTAVLEAPVTRRGWFSQWSSVTLRGQDYRNFGELLAWRATLWADNQLLAEQRSFLW